MRFLLDECLSQRLVPLLEEAGHDVLHVVDSGLAGGIDHDVLEMARTDGRVLVSSDTDFGELLARAGTALPSLVLFRQGNRAPEHQAATLLGNLEQIAEDVTTARKLGAAEIVINAQFSPGVETAKDLVARMEEFWRVAKGA